MSPPPDRRRTFVLGVLKGEGVGPEVIDATLDVLQALSRAASLRVELRIGGAIGLAAEQQYSCSLTADVIGFCRKIFDDEGAVLCGPGGGRFVYDLRTEFDLYCKLIPLQPRPALQDAGVIRPERLGGTDIVVVRENTGGLYFGSWGAGEHSGSPRTAYQECAYREDEVARIVQVGLELAARRRGRLAVVTKPGGVPAISQLWQQTLERSAEGRGLDTRVLEIDNAAYQLIAHPREFDVVVCPNMFGDVLGDCGALLLGSRGMSYSGNFAVGGPAVYQTGHGAAWDLAGRDQANPIGQISSLAMLLRESWNQPEAAGAIEGAIDVTLAAGIRTPDIAGPDSRIVGTREMGRCIAASLADLLADEAV